MRSVCSGRHHSAGFTQGMRCLFSRSKSHTHTHKTAINGKTASLCEALSKERTLRREQSTSTSTFTTFDLLLKWHGVDRVINSCFYEPEWLPGGTLHTAQSKQKEKGKCAQTAAPNKWLQPLNLIKDGQTGAEILHCKRKLHNGAQLRAGGRRDSGH